MSNVSAGNVPPPRRSTETREIIDPMNRLHSVPRRSLVVLGLTLAVTAFAPRPAVASDPVLGLLTVLIRQQPVQVQQPQPAQPTYVPQQSVTQAPTYYYYYPVQNTVNAAMTYWTGQQPVAAQPAATQPVAAQPATAQPAAAPTYGDAYGFTAWLNGVRAQYGLAPVSHDSNLAAWANMNNAQQNNQGLGHHVMGPARRQNSAMGSAASIGSQWLASPAHAAALLDPSIRVIGIAGMGAYWTFNAY